MPLADAATRIADREGRRASCSVGRVFAAVDDADRALLESWLEKSSGRTNVWIAAVLAADGHVNSKGQAISYQSVQRHRVRVCGCFL